MESNLVSKSWILFSVPLQSGARPFRHPLGMNLNYKIISFFPHPRQSYTELSDIQLTSLQLYRALSFSFEFASFPRNAYQVFLYPCIIKTLSAFLKSISYSITFNFNENYLASIESIGIICQNKNIIISYIFLKIKSSLDAATAKSFQSCLTLCDPIDDLLPGSSVPGILQAKTLEWVAISFSNA